MTRTFQSLGWVAVVAVAACTHAPPVGEKPCPEATLAPPPADGPREALRAFVVASEARQFDAAWRLLASPVRGRYTPARLGEDLEAVGPAGRDRLARAKVAAATAPRVSGEVAEFDVGAGKAVRMVHEPDGWKVEAIE